MSDSPVVRSEIEMILRLQPNRVAWVTALLIFFSPLFHLDAKDAHINMDWNSTPLDGTTYSKHYVERTVCVLHKKRKYPPEVDGFTYSSGEEFSQLQVDELGNVYLHYLSSATIRRFSPNGKNVTIFRYSDYSEHFGESERVAAKRTYTVGGEGRLLLCDWTGTHAVELDRDGRVVAKYKIDGSELLGKYRNTYLFLGKRKISEIEKRFRKLGKHEQISGIEHERVGRSAKWRIKGSHFRKPVEVDLSEVRMGDYSGGHINNTYFVDRYLNLYLLVSIPNPLDMKNPGRFDNAWGIVKLDTSTGKILAAFPLHRGFVVVIAIDDEGNIYQKWYGGRDKAYVTKWKVITDKE